MTHKFKNLKRGLERVGELVGGGGGVGKGEFELVGDETMQ